MTFVHRITSIIITLFTATTVFSQYAFDRSVMIDAKINKSTPSITLNWNKYAAATNYSIYRKAKSSNSWGSIITTLNVADTSWTDLNVQVGNAYEYKIVRTGGTYIGNGYIYSGIDLPIDPYEGKIIVLVDSTLAKDLKKEIDLYMEDLTGEGWIPIYQEVSPNMKVVQVKQIINDYYNQDPVNTKSLFLVGHIPVPYSGDLNPDGHQDHLGAWPADAYYADIDGVWTDVTVNDANAADPRNRNIPGDGKFDQTYIPSPVELQVGRVDFNDMPLFKDNALELTRKYFKKNHSFRTKEFVAERRGLLQDNFNYTEGFSQSAYMSFSSMFGKDKVFIKDYRSNLSSYSYLWSYGCGGGNYQAASGISSTTNFTVDSLQTVFTMMFGSYFGDWDTQNNFLRAAIASGQTLSNAWVGRPNWHFHYMSMGETIGYDTKLAMNNTNALSVYYAGSSANKVHIALMGDPSLKLFPLSPVVKLNLTDLNGNVTLNWTAYKDNLDHYEVYKRSTVKDEFVWTSNVSAKETSYIDSCVVQGQNIEYLVRASVLETTASGTYFNLSKGAHESIISTSAMPPLLNVSYIIQNEKVVFTTSGNAVSYIWNFGDGTLSSEVSPEHSYNASGTYSIILKTMYSCTIKLDTFIVSVILTDVPSTVHFSGIKLYPTIVNNDLTVVLNHITKLSWKIFNVNGQILKKGQYAEKILTLNVAELVNGMYYIELNTNRETVVKNFCVQH